MSRALPPRFIRFILRLISAAFFRPERMPRGVMHAPHAHVGHVTWEARHRRKVRWRPEQKTIKRSQKHPNQRHDGADARTAREENAF